MEATKEAPAAAAAAPAGGGIKAMLPLILNVVLMPAIAYGLTMFVLLPKLRAPAASHVAPAGDAAEGHDAAAGEHGEAKADSHGAAKEAHEPAKDAHGAPKDAHGGGGAAAGGPVPLGAKILVNVAGTAGTRYLQASLSLSGKKSNLKDLIEKHDARLRDAASSALAAKTIADLEKPGARSLIRTELIGAFNMILGNGTVTDIFLTEFAIQ